MVSTFQALAVAVLALIPGALYVWGFERQAGRWGIGLSDRLLRFLGASVLLHALAAPATYSLYREFVHSGKLGNAAALPAWTWPVLLTYVAAPTALGTIVGSATRGGRRWGRWLAGPSPAPRAWDHLFARRGLTGWVILKLKDGTWLAGAFAGSESGTFTSYAAGYPEVPDLYLAEAVEVSADGKLIVGADGSPRLRGTGVLVRWDEVAFLEFVEARP
jgi:hypothetical protein